MKKLLSLLLSVYSTTGLCHPGHGMIKHNDLLHYLFDHYFLSLFVIAFTTIVIIKFYKLKK